MSMDPLFKEMDAMHMKDYFEGVNLLFMQTELVLCHIDLFKAFCRACWSKTRPPMLTKLQKTMLKTLQTGQKRSFIQMLIKASKNELR